MIALKLERRTLTPIWLTLLLPLLAVLVALLLCSGLIALAGANILESYAMLFSSALVGKFNFADTMVKAAPLIFTGLAVAVAFRAKFWNIGAEGQLLAGAMASAYVGSFPGLPGPVSIIAMFFAGALGGAFLAAIPAFLRTQLKVDDVVSTLFLNSIVYYSLMGLLEGPWKDPLSGYPISPPIQDSAHFPVLLSGTQLHLGVLIAFLAAPVVWFVMRHTTLGFAIRITGENVEAARYGGIRVERVILFTACLSGALAGLAGAGEVGGIQYQLMAEISPGYGYTGIIIAMLAQLNPLGVVPAAFFFATIFTGSEALARATGVPVFLANVIQGSTLLTMLVALLFTSYRLRRVN